MDTLIKIKFVCELCSKTCEKPGALVISPPQDNDNEGFYYDKHHICSDCYKGMRFNLGWVYDVVKEVKANEHG